MQAIGSGGLSSWNIETEGTSLEDKQNSGISEQTRILQQQSKKGRRRGKNKRAAAQSDSEEEETITMLSVDWLMKKFYTGRAYFKQHDAWCVAPSSI